MARKKTNPLVHAATLLPLAIGLASNISTPTTPAAPRASVVSKAGPACTLPFDAIKEHHPIDDSCFADGSAQPDTPQSAQNDAKNNFCSTGTPVNIDVDVLRQLQQDAAKPGSGITFGSDGQLPKDRTVLRNLPTTAGPLSEGTVVRLVAYVMDAHYSNLGRKPSRRCLRAPLRTRRFCPRRHGQFVSVPDVWLRSHHHVEGERDSSVRDARTGGGFAGDHQPAG